jgi:hypothetical protein
MKRSPTLVPLAAVVAMACGAKEKQSEPAPDKTPSPVSKPAPAPEPSAPVAYPEVLDHLPRSTFLVVELATPDKTQTTFSQLISKAGLQSDAIVVRQLGEFAQEMGVGLLDASAWSTLGIAPAKGIALGIDGELLQEDFYLDTYAGMLRVYPDPTMYATFAVDDVTKFDKWIRDRVLADKTRSATFEDIDIGGRKGVMVFRGPYDGSVPTGAELVPPGGVPSPVRVEVPSPSIEVQPGKVKLTPATPAPSPVSPGAPPMNIARPFEKLGEPLAKRAAPAPEPAAEMPYPAPPPLTPPVGIVAPPSPLPVPPPVVAAPEKRLSMVWVQDGAFVYVFDVSVDANIPTPEAPDAVGKFKVGLADFFGRLSNPLPKTANFTQVAKRVSPSADAFFFVELSVLPRIAEVDKSRIIFLAPKDETQRRAQESERQYQSENRPYEERQKAQLKALVAATPALAFSISGDTSKITGKGYMPVEQSFQSIAKDALVPSAKAPDYGTLFDAKTSFMVRFSMPPVGMRALISSLLDDESRSGFVKEMAETKAQLAPLLGLDLDSDVLSAFTGHMALAGPATSIMSFLLSGDESAGAAPLAAVAQVVSPEAGDKLVEGVKKAAGLAGILFSQEEVGGVVVYSGNFDRTPFAFARVNDLLVGGFGALAVKETVKRVQAPAGSFVDGLGSPLAKELLTSPAASGGSGDLGAALTMSDVGALSSPDGLFFLALGKFLGRMTMRAEYTDGGATCSCELLLK